MMLKILKKVLPFVLAALLLLALGYGASALLGPMLAPPPTDVLAAFWGLLVQGELPRDLGITVGRALTGLAMGAAIGTFLGALAGLSPFVMRMLAPLIAGVQSCPPVVWISLAMVWAGTGGAVPVAVVLVTTGPIFFSNSAYGVQSTDQRLRGMSRLYNVPWLRRLRRLYLPSLRPYWISGFSIALSTGWKTAAVAEFLGSHEGIGARIYWCYRALNMAELFACALALILLGAVLELALIAPLRQRGRNAQKRSLSGSASLPDPALLPNQASPSNQASLSDSALTLEPKSTPAPESTLAPASACEAALTFELATAPEAVPQFESPSTPGQALSPTPDASGKLAAEQSAHADNTVTASTPKMEDVG